MSYSKLYLGYHIVKKKPVLKAVREWFGTIDGETTYWISFAKQGEIITIEHLKTKYTCIAKRGKHED